MPADDFRVLVLDADHTFGGPNLLHGDLQAAKDRFRPVVQKFLVLVQQGFALGGIHDDRAGG
jgi:hypothetical protein